MQRIIILFSITVILLVNVYSQSYNPQAAIDYANNWWDGRNTMKGVKSQASYAKTWGNPYNNYNASITNPNLGGDCANFVSQCLKAGGLDLSKGANGTGNGLDNRGCITGVQNLVTHLKNYQQTEYYMTTNALGGTDVLKTTDAGDPVFVGNIVDNYKHSLFCTSVVGTGNLYSSHSSDYHNEPYTTWNYPWAYYFHIKSSIPDHCSNCKLDEDETDIDCGGSCPPCQKAKSSVNYNYNTIFLPQTTRAIGTIMAGNADVHVLQGQDVTFISAGEIILKPGFHVHKGASFHGERKAMRKDIGADCGKFCEPARPNYICRDREPYFYGWELANFTRCSVVIYQKCFTLWRAIYSEEKDINADGHILLWDLKSGIKDNSFCKQNVFYYTVILTYCDGYQYKYEGSLTVGNCQKSLSSDLVEDNSVVSLDELNDNDWNIYPNPNSGSFTIGINDISEIQQIQVFSPIGQMVYSVQNPDNNMINLPSTAKGTFFVKIITQTETVIKKIIVE